MIRLRAFACVVAASALALPVSIHCWADGISTPSMVTTQPARSPLSETEVEPLPSVVSPLRGISAVRTYVDDEVKDATFDKDDLLSKIDGKLIAGGISVDSNAHIDLPLVVVDVEEMKISETGLVEYIVTTSLNDGVVIHRTSAQRVVQRLPDGSTIQTLAEIQLKSDIWRETHYGYCPSAQFTDIVRTQALADVDYLIHCYIVANPSAKSPKA